MKRNALSLVILLALALVSFAQEGSPPVPVRALWTTTALPAGGTGELGVILDVPKGHHITDVEYGLFFVNAPDTFGLQFGEPVYPPGVRYADERAYRGRTIVRVPVTVSAAAATGTVTFPLNVGYQICQEFGQETCFLPDETTVTVTLEIVPAGTTVAPANQDAFIVTAEEAPATLEERLLAALETGSWLAFLLVFLGGILTSFTPCVYPIIPITIGYIGGSSKGKPLRGLGLSAVFVLGIALVYSTLGLVSAATGSLFGSISASPWVTAAVAAIFALMGFSMLGAFEIALPSSWQTKLQSSSKGSGLLGPLLIGMVSGVVMAPCVGPVIVALLVWVSKTGSLLYGWSLLFVFSLGLGLLFLVIGTFAGAIQALPRAGAWMDAIKHGFGWILLAAALFLLRLVIPEPYNTLAWALLLIVFAVFTGAFDSLSADAGAKRRLWKAATLLAFLVGAILLFKVFAPIGAQTAAPGAEVSWIINEEAEAFAAAADQDKPLIMDFYADWCVACVELDEKTWVVPDVARRLDAFVRLKMDFTHDTPWVKEMLEKYRITGMPTVILFNPSGGEIARFTGFLPARDVLALLDRHRL